MARPRKEIDQREFESLLTIQCTLSEVTAFFDHKLDGCSEDTIERWCKRTYNTGFAEIAAKKREVGKISLRRMQWRLAENNASVCIFLGKNYLKQTDAPMMEQEKVDDDGFLKALSGTAQEDWEDEE